MHSPAEYVSLVIFSSDAGLSDQSVCLLSHGSVLFRCSLEKVPLSSEYTSWNELEGISVSELSVFIAIVIGAGLGNY